VTNPIGMNARKENIIFKKRENTLAVHKTGTKFRTLTPFRHIGLTLPNPLMEEVENTRNSC
jgi:hypothetical protein